MPAPFTPDPRRFLPKRPGIDSSTQRTPASSGPRFYSTPKFGAPSTSSATRYKKLEDVESDSSNEEAESTDNEDNNAVSSLEEEIERQVKRRRVLDIEDATQETEEEGNPAASQDEDEDNQLNAKEDAGDDNKSSKPAPVFRAAPRFKPAPQDEDEAFKSPLVPFSPRGKKKGYVPGGLAEGLQSWLSEVRGTTEESVVGSKGLEMQLFVKEARPGTRMVLIRAEPKENDQAKSSNEAADKKYILAGPGAGRGETVVVGATILVKRPIWDMELDNETWTVVCNWDVET